MSAPAADIDRPRIGIVSNPRARRNRSQLPAIERIVANHPSIHHFVPSTEEETGTTLQQAAETGIDVLAINGGDGTVARVLTELLTLKPFDRTPSIVLLPGGTTNMNAADIGMHGSLRRNIARLVRWGETGQGRVERKLRPVLRVRQGPDTPARYGMFFGAGSIVRGMEYCQKHLHTLGLTSEIGPAITTLRAIWGMLRNDPAFTAPIEVRIETGERTDTSVRTVNLLVISSLERLFLGFHPYWGEEDAPLHCTWIQQPARRLIRLTPSILRGRRHRHLTPDNGYYSRNTARVRLWMESGYAIDGEIYHATGSEPLVVDNGGELEFLRIGK